MLRPRMAGREREGFHLEGSSSALRRIAARRCFCVSRVIVQRGGCRLALLGLFGLRFPRGRMAWLAPVGAVGLIRIAFPAWSYSAGGGGWRCRAYPDCVSRVVVQRVVWRLALPGLFGLRFPHDRTAWGVPVAAGVFIRLPTPAGPYSAGVPVAAVELIRFAFPAWPYSVACAGWRCWAYPACVFHADTQRMRPVGTRKSAAAIFGCGALLHRFMQGAGAPLLPLSRAGCCRPRRTGA